MAICWRQRVTHLRYEDGLICFRRRRPLTCDALKFADFLHLSTVQQALSLVVLQGMSETECPTNSRSTKHNQCFDELAGELVCGPAPFSLPLIQLAVELCHHLSTSKVTWRFTVSKLLDEQVGSEAWGPSTDVQTDRGANHRFPQP